MTGKQQKEGQKETDRESERDRGGGRGNTEVRQGKTERPRRRWVRGLGERRKRPGKGRRGEVGRETERTEEGEIDK